MKLQVSKLSVFRDFISRPHQSVSLRRGMLNLLGTIFVGSLLVMGFGVTRFVYQTEQSAWQDRQTEITRNAVKTMGLFMRDSRQALFQISFFDPAYLNANPQILYKFLHAENGFLELVYVDAHGQVIAHADRDTPILAASFTIAASNWFHLARIGQTYLGDVEISSPNKPYMIIAVPAFAGGVVAVRLEMQVLSDVVNDVHFAHSGRVYVIDHNGRIVAHTDPRFVLNNTNIERRPEFVAALQAPDQTWTGHYVNFEDLPVVGQYAPLPGTDWLVVTEVETAETHAVARAAFTLLGGIMVLFAVLIFGITLNRLDKTLFVPIKRLRDGVLRIGRGDLDFHIDVINSK